MPPCCEHAEGVETREHAHREGERDKQQENKKGTVGTSL